VVEGGGPSARPTVIHVRRDCQWKFRAYNAPVNGGYSWNDTRDGGTYRLPGPEHIGWWAGAAMVVSILLHVVVFVVLDQLEIGLGLAEVKEITTAPMNVEQVEVEPEAPPDKPAPPDEAVVPPTSPSRQ